MSKVLFVFILLLGASFQAHAGGDFCSDYPNGVVDGSLPGTFPLPSAFGIDRSCTIINFPLGNPLAPDGWRPTLNFYTPDKNNVYLIVFDNVYFNGNMACSSIPHKLWAVNSAGFKASCQSIMIPAEMIDKRSPALAAAVGVPFTYTLTLPSMNYPAGDPSTNTLGSVILTDDLTATGTRRVGVDGTVQSTGAELTYVSHTAYIKGGATLTAGTDYTFSNGGDDKHLRFDFGQIPAGRQIVVEMTVVLDNVLPINQVGNTFINTAEWTFSRSIDIDENNIIEWAADTNGDGIYDTGDDADGDGLLENEFFDPLPGESGVAGLMTITEPNLVLNKTSSTAAMNLGTTATYTVSVQNTGGTTAWNTSILDTLPVGMCDYFTASGTGGVSLAIYDAAGTSLLRSLTAPTDYTLTWVGDPTCKLTLDLKSANAAIAPDEQLKITYPGKLDADVVDGSTHTNIAVAQQWFNADSTIATRKKYGPYTSTDGSEPYADTQTITATLSGYFFKKFVTNTTTGESPALTASPGDILRYTLQLENYNIPSLTGISITDDLGALNGNNYIVPGSLSIVSLSNTFPVAPVVGTGTNGAGSITLSGFDLATNQSHQLQFDVTVGTDANGNIVQNQASITGTDSATLATLTGVSDDPFISGPIALGTGGDITTVNVLTGGALRKQNNELTATIGQQFSYTIRVPATPVNTPLYDVVITDNLVATGVDLKFVHAIVQPGSSWTGDVTNTGTGSSATNLVLQNDITGIDIPANGYVEIKVTVELLNTLNNTSGDLFHNTASYSYDRTNGGGLLVTPTPNPATDTTADMTIVEPNLTATKAVTFVSPAGKVPPATVGDVLRYTVTIPNNGSSAAYDVSVVDLLPTDVMLVPGSATASLYDGTTTTPVSGFVVDPEPTAAASNKLIWGGQNGDVSLDIPLGQSLILTYEVTVKAVTGSNIQNTVYVDWISWDGVSADGPRTGSGCPIISAPNTYCAGPAQTTVATQDNTYITKAWVSDTYGETPPSTADPIVRVGDTITYDLTLNLQEYTTRSVAVEDLLPVGMQLQSFTITPASGGTFTYTMGAQPTPGATSTLRWEFGDITNTPSNDGTPLDQLVIRYVAKVVTNAPPAGVNLPSGSSTDTSILRNNQAKLFYNGLDPALYPARLTATETIDVRQPLMSLISKVDQGTGRTGSGTDPDPYQVNIASDVMQFHLSSCNDGLAPAYGVVITDLLATELDETDLATTPPVVKIGGTTLIAGTHYTYTAPGRGGEMRIALLDTAPVNTSECVTVDYSLGFHTDLTAQSKWSNTAKLPEYRSLPLAQPGRIYTSTAQAQVWMTNLVSVQPLAKTLTSAPEATIGEPVVYTITVPRLPVNVALNSVEVSDTLHDALVYEGATATLNGAPLLITTTPTGQQLKIAVGTIPAGQQVVITLTSRVANNTFANAGVSFTNTASYSYTGIPAGAVTSGTSGTLKIVEPVLALGKTVTNVSNPGQAPNAGDILRYSVTLTASGGVAADNFSSVFDVSIVDQLSMGLAYKSGTATVNGAGNTITNPAITGDGVTTAQMLTWNLADATANIDVPEGAPNMVTVTYDVVVLDTVLAGQALTNSATAQWTSLNGANANERNGTGGLNDYFTGPVTQTLTTQDNTVVTKSRLTDTFGAADADVRVGDLIDYEVRIHLDEGSHNGLVLSDVLPHGLQFEQVVSINGDTSAPYGAVVPFSYANIAAPSVSGSAATGPTTVTWTLGNVVNVGDNNAANDEFVIVYRARVLDSALAQANTTPLLNTATLNYTTASGATSKSDTESVSLQQPMLTVSKSAAPAGGDTSITSGEQITYTVNVINSGTAPAYDTVVRDVLPVGLRQGGVTTTSITLQPAGTALSVLAPSYDPATGIVTWNFDTGVANAYTIPANQTLRITYTVNADANLGPGLTLTNGVQATAYYSFDNNLVPTAGTVSGVRQTYGPSNTAQQTLTTPLPGAPLKENPVGMTSATIGQEFTYTITVPAIPQPTALHDVRIHDDLGVTGANLTLVGLSKVSGSQSWTPTNIGTPTDLLIADTTNGIEIPANEQIVIGVTVRMNNATGNVSGVTFSNTASYTYNQIDGDSATQMNGGSSATTNMTVAEPNLTATKLATNATPGKAPGDPIAGGDIIHYVVTIHNGGTAPAYDVNVVDTLPSALSFYSGFTPTATINTSPVAGFVATPAGTPSGPLVWGRGNGDSTLDIPVNGDLVLTYRTQVLESTVATFSNQVWVDWTSLDGTNSNERTGAGCPTATAPNSYCFGPASATTTTTDSNSLTKAIVADLYVDASSTSTDKIARIGDTATYRLTLKLGEGTTRSVKVVDALPAGMAYDSLVGITPASGSGSFTYSPISQPTAGATGNLIWDLGNVVNTPSNNNTPIDELIIEYTARVQPNAGITQTPSSLTNSATLSYLDGSSNLVSKGPVSDVLTVWQPVMSTLLKSDRLGRTGTASAPLNVNVASDTMQFRLESCNNGHAPAYEMLLTDVLPSQLNETSLTAPTVTVGGVVLGAAAYSYTPPAVRGGTMSIQLHVPVERNQCVTVDYDIGFHTDFGANQIWNNSATLSEYWSLPALAGQRYAPSGTSQFFMTNQVIVQPPAKSVLSPVSGEATIGEEVVYQITVPASPVNAALDNVRVTDSLHGALVYVAATAVDRNGAAITLTDSSTASLVDLTIASIPAGQQAIITLRTRVDNNDQANAGTSFSNTASYTYTGNPSGLLTSAPSGLVKIVEPLVTVTKSVPATSPNAGDILTYTLTFTAAGAGAGDNFANAFDLTIEDSLGLGLLYEPGSATLNGVLLADPSTNGGDGVTTAQKLTWDPANGIDIDIAEGTTVAVTYSVRVLASAAPGTTLTNSAIGRWTSLNGVNGFERIGSGTPVVNDYFTLPATTTLTSQLAVSFTKSVVNVTTGQTPGDNAKPGDTLRYTLVLTNQSVLPVNGVMVVDELAAQFAPGTLQITSTLPAGANASGTSATGGINRTGIVDIRNLTLAAMGDAGGNDTVTITFEAKLAAAIDSSTTVLNQAQLSAANLTTKTSNQTSTLISSAPIMQVYKTSQDINGGVLMAGDTLRYTITVKNIGNENAQGVTLRDLIPGFTTYVANSTRLNGVQVADSLGISALNTGMPIKSPEDTVAGGMRANADPTHLTNVATITFDVVIKSDVLNGTIISNQGFVNGSGVGSGPFVETPSDDPATATLNDPTRNIVGNLPMLDATKTVTLIDNGTTPNAVDPGDTLRYTITVNNLGMIPATGVKLTDTVPLNTTYVANTVKLNGNAVPDSAGSPLVAGISINSPTSAPGTIPAGGNAVVTFDVLVSAVSAGTVISNQGSVASNELATEPTDADGDDSNGDQPTVVVVGSAQQLSIVKEVIDVNGGVALPGDTLEYVVTITNDGPVDATNVVITDDLTPLSGQASYVANSATLNGLTTGVSYTAPVVTATVGNLAMGATATLRFRVLLGSASTLPVGTTVTNTAQVAWSTAPTLYASSSVSVDIGAMPGTATLNGHIWHDVNFSNSPDTGETNMAGWTVTLYRNSVPLGSVTSDGSGLYSFSGLAPTVGADQYEIRFSAPGAGANTASLGMADSPFTNAPQRISAITALSGSIVQNLNLPIDPNGVVYDAIRRTPIAGATLTMTELGSTVPLPSSCFADNQQGQVTLASGFYKFDLKLGDPACPAVAGSDYVIRVTPPATGYEQTVSRIIPPSSSDTSVYSVPFCSSDAVGTPAGYCEAQSSASAPGVAVPARTAGTDYYLHLTLSTPVPGASQIFNNHIPLDPTLQSALTITKTAALVNVSRGQLVPYTITVTNTMGVDLTNMSIVDAFPAGFKYVTSSSRVNGKAIEPVINNLQLNWNNLQLINNTPLTIKLLFIVGSGVGEGEYVNRARVVNTLSGSATGDATATVRVIPDPTFDCTDIIGKVFDDANRNGYQDKGEKGLPGVRLATARGLLVKTDEYGRYHITCAATPDENRGSNFIIKVDERTLPTGYRITTDNPLVLRATRGKMMKFNFGATIHKVVRLDMSNGVFEPGKTDLRIQWKARMDLVMNELKKGPSLLRLAYMAEVEDEGLVADRLEAVKQEIAQRWAQQQGGYELEIETEVFWRTGAPPDRSRVK